ncbi:MAG: hypothetical protein PHR35_19355, partial [Kiritimatiellae bacterium]|nr:hypothetical protein [Kiritimatiellia bacterium]
RRDYYLSVGSDIDYQGRSLDHLMIPAGKSFSADLFGTATELTWAFTPVGFNCSDSLSVTPSLNAGLLLFLGAYSIDAGEPSGVVTYQNPPEDFAVGGESSGVVGMGIPQIGPGLSVRGWFENDIDLLIQAQYLMFSYDGSTSFLTTASHREKNADIDHSSLRLRAQMEFPLSDGLRLNAGLTVQIIDSEGLISSTATDADEIRAARERFDKMFAFRLSTVMAHVGLTF